VYKMTIIIQSKAVSLFDLLSVSCKFLLFLMGFEFYAFVIVSFFLQQSFHSNWIGEISFNLFYKSDTCLLNK
jgi:hypothetical protein